MKTSALRLASALAVLAAACATFDLVEVWHDPRPATPARRALVVAAIPDDACRAAFENAMAGALAASGLAASTAGAAFPRGPLDREEAASYLVQEGIDLVVVLRLARETRGFVPSRSLYVPPAPYFGGWYGTYAYGYGAASSTGSLADATPVLAEANAYATGAGLGRLVWSGSSSTFLYRSASASAPRVAAAVASDLAKAGFLVHR